MSNESRDMVLNAVRSGEINDIEKLNEKLVDIFQNYGKDSWQWCTALIESRYGKSFAELSQEDFTTMIEDWKKNAVKLNNMILNDARKEFDVLSVIAYGVDGNDEDVQKDFQTVRGSLETNSFVTNLQQDSEDITLKAESLLSRFEK